MTVLADASLLSFNGTILVQALIFLVTAVVLYKLAWGRLLSVIDARNAKIESGLRAASDAESRLLTAAAEVQKELEQARSQARDILSRAHAEATADAEEVRARSRQEAESIVEKARADIGIERDRALQELRAQVSGMVVDAAGRVLGQAIDTTAHRRLIEESLAEVGTR